MRNGGMARGSNVTNVVYEEGASAQALDLVGNPPSQATTIHLRVEVVGRVQDPRGPSFTALGDTNVHGRATNVASAWASNNNLV